MSSWRYVSNPRSLENYKINLNLDGVQITIERDEEGNYRALGDSEKIKDSKVEVDLIQDIIRVLESL